MCTITRNATLWVVLLTALLASAAVALVPVIGIDGLVTIFNEKGAPIGSVSIDIAWEDVYAMDMAVGTPPLPAGKGRAILTLTLTVTDPALNEQMKQWGDTFFFLNDDGEFAPITKDRDGQFRLPIDLRDIHPGLKRIPVFYRFRASRDHSGIRPLGVKITMNSKMGDGAGASGICLWVVSPEEDLFDGKIDKDAVLGWAQRLHNRAVGGDERVAIGGLRSLFTPRSVNQPDPAQQAFIQQQLDAIKAQAKIEVENATKNAGEAAAQELKTQYDGQISDLTQKLGQAQGDAAANAAALVAANRVLAEMRADAEHRAAAQVARLDVPKPAEPADERPVAPAPWTAQYDGASLIICANTDGVRLKICYGKGFKPIPETTLSKGRWAQIAVTPSLRAEVSVAADGGRLTQVYGPHGPVER